MNEAREEERRPQRREGRLAVATTRHAEGSAAREGRVLCRSVAEAEERGRLQPEAPGTLFMSRSAAQAYHMLKAADAGRWRSRGGGRLDAATATRLIS